MFQWTAHPPVFRRRPLFPIRTTIGQARSHDPGRTALKQETRPAGDAGEPGELIRSGLIRPPAAEEEAAMPVRGSLSRQQPGIWLQ
jgi:hypothetical protein